MSIDTAIEASDRYQQTSARVATERLLERLREHHDYAVHMPVGYVKAEPIIVKPADVVPEPIAERTKADWFRIIDDGPPASLPPPAPLTMQVIRNAVCKYFNTTPVKLVARRRTKEIVYHRSIAIYLARELTDRSWPQISRAFGDLDHSTGIHAAQKIERKLSECEQTQRDIAYLTSLLVPQFAEAAE